MASPGSFSTAQVSRLTGLSVRHLDHWDLQGFMRLRRYVRTFQKLDPPRKGMAAAVARQPRLDVFDFDGSVEERRYRSH